MFRFILGFIIIASLLGPLVCDGGESEYNKDVDPIAEKIMRQLGKDPANYRKRDDAPDHGVQLSEKQQQDIERVLIGEDSDEKSDESDKKSNDTWKWILFALLALALVALVVALCAGAIGLLPFLIGLLLIAGFALLLMVLANNGVDVPNPIEAAGEFFENIFDGVKNAVDTVKTFFDKVIEIAGDVLKIGLMVVACIIGAFILFKVCGACACIAKQYKSCKEKREARKEQKRDFCVEDAHSKRRLSGIEKWHRLNKPMV